MKKLVILCMLQFASFPSFASIDYITVKECRSLLFGKSTEGDVQKKMNEELKKELNKAGAKTVFFIKYGDEESFFRSKENACIIATAWYSN